jgi:hypothetical protein
MLSSSVLTFYIVDIFFQSTFDFRHFFVDIFLSTFYRRRLTTFPYEIMRPNM